MTDLNASSTTMNDRLATAEEAGPADVLADAVALLREAATLYDAREQPESAGLLRRLARELTPTPAAAPPATDRAADRGPWTADGRLKPHAIPAATMPDQPSMTGGFDDSIDTTSAQQATDRAHAEEAHRLALSTVLGLGTGAPWDAVRARATELAASGNRAAGEADADTVASRAAQVIATMGAEIRELKGHRDRYRTAWHNARARAGVLSAELTRRAPLLAEHAAEIEKLIRWHREDGDALAEMRATIGRLRAERKRQPDRGAVLREEAARIRAHCPDHLDSGSVPGAWMACHCDVADDLLRRMADETPQVETRDEAQECALCGHRICMLGKPCGVIATEHGDLPEPCGCTGGEARQPETCANCRGSGLDPRYSTGDFACPDCPPAVVAQPAKEAHAPQTVAYRSNGGRLLRCIAHAPEWAAILCGDFHPVTSDDLPDGGICTMPDCGVDVLIPQQPKEA